MRRADIRRRSILPAWMPQSAIWLVPVNLAIFVWLASTHDAFLTERSLDTLMSNFAITAVIGLAQMVVIAAGGMNLALGAIGALSGLATSFLMVDASIPVFAAVIAGVVVGSLCGAVNGFIIAQFGLSAFIVTLATASVFTGIALGLTQAQPITNLPDSFLALGEEQIFGIPIVLILSTAAIILVALIFHSLGFGRQILAFGGNPLATDLAGLPRRRVLMTVQALSGGLAAWAGILLITLVGQGQPDVGRDWLLSSFAAPIIGGTLLAGGYLTVAGTCLAAFLLTQVASAIVFVGLNPFWVQLVQGLIIVIAALLDRIRPAASSRRRLSPSNAEAVSG